MLEINNIYLMDYSDFLEKIDDNTVHLAVKLNK